jgi:hypothetical protein
MDASEYSVLLSRVDSSLKTVTNSLLSGSYNNRESVHMNFLVLADLLIRPEFISFDYISVLSSILKSVAEMPDSVLFSLPGEFDQAYFRVVSSFFVRIQHEYNVNMKTENFTEYLSSSFSSSFKKKTSNMRERSKTVWTSSEQYLSRVSSKTNSSSPVLEFSTEFAAFKNEYRIAGTVNGTSYSIHSSRSYNIDFPSNLYDSTEITDMSSSVNVVSISWISNPLRLSSESSYLLTSDFVSVFIYSTSKGILEITGKTLSIQIPFVNSRISSGRE